MEHRSVAYALVARQEIHDFTLRKAQSDRLLATPFIATWYLLGMLIPTAIGAWLGPRLLRW